MNRGSPVFARVGLIGNRCYAMAGGGKKLSTKSSGEKTESGKGTHSQGIKNMRTVCRARGTDWETGGISETSIAHC